MDRRYEALCGITQEELEKYFEEPIIRMAERYEYTKEEMLGRLKEEYDGYHFGEEMIDIYNPFSILNAFDEEDYGLRRPILSFTGIYRLQGGCGEALADDLSERVSDDKRMG